MESSRSSEAGVIGALKSLGVSAQVRVFAAPTATAQQAAEAIDTALGSIVKTLCFLVVNEPVIVLTAGDRQVDDRKLGALHQVSRKKVRIADAQTTLQVTGFAPGGVPPVGFPQPLPVYVDSSLQRFETVYAAAGSPYAIFPIRLDDLIRITGGRIVDVAKD